MAIADQARAIYDKSKPWRKDVPWPAVAIQGAVLLVIGIYVLADKSGATRNIGFLISIILIYNGLTNLIAGLRDGDNANPLTQTRLVQAGVAITAGAIAGLDRLSDYLSANAVRGILGWGLLATGLLGLYGLVMAREQLGLRPAAFVPGLLLLVLGLAFIYNALADKSSSSLIGVIAIIAGAGLLGYAYLRYSASKNETIEPVPAA